MTFLEVFSQLYLLQLVLELALEHAGAHPSVNANPEPQKAENLRRLRLAEVCQDLSGKTASSWTLSGLAR